jgi:hypothetical protein
MVRNRTFRIFCLGLFRAWGAEFDVYDKQGNIIGVIDGQVATTESAKYSIYNAKEEACCNCLFRPD